MATITLRSVKGSALTHTEMDNNFNNLNTDKLENAGDTITGSLTFNTGANTDSVIDEDGIDRSSGSAETFNIQNSGAGAMTLQIDGNTVWHSGNDGPSSTLDADTVDGYEGAELAVLAESETISGSWTFSTTTIMQGALTLDTGANTNAILDEGGIARSSASSETFNINNGGAGSMTLQVDGYTVMTTNNGGAGSTFDADLLDSQHGSYYLARANHTGTQTLSTISDAGAMAALDTADSTYFDFSGDSPWCGDIWLDSDTSATFSSTSWATITRVDASTPGSVYLWVPAGATYLTISIYGKSKDVNVRLNVRLYNASGSSGSAHINAGSSGYGWATSTAGDVSALAGTWANFTIQAKADNLYDVGQLYTKINYYFS